MKNSTSRRFEAARVWTYRFIFCGLISVHLVLTFAYLVPENLLASELSNWTEQYIGQFFKQNWHLFSPNPGIADTDLWVKCENKEHTGTWLVPYGELQKFHQNTRITGAGKYLYVYSSMARKLLEDYSTELSRLQTECLQKSEEKSKPDCSPEKFAKQTMGFVMEQDFYKQATRIATDLCTKEGERNFGYTLRLVTTYPKRFSERTSKKLYGHVHAITFPMGFLVGTPNS